MCLFVELHHLHDVFYVAKCMPMFYQVLGELRLLGVVLKGPHVFLIPRVEITTCLSDIRFATIRTCQFVNPGSGVFVNPIHKEYSNNNHLNEE